MDPLDIIKLIAGIGGGTFGAIQNQQNISNNKEIANKQLQQQADQFAQTLKQQQGMAGLGATQLNPFAQQGSRQKQALLGSLAQNYTPVSYSQGKFSGGLTNPNLFSGIQSYFGPEAMKSAEADFTKNVQQASPNYSGPSAGTGNTSVPTSVQYFTQGQGSGSGGEGFMPRFGGGGGGGDQPTMMQGEFQPDSLSGIRDTFNIWDQLNGYDPSSGYDPMDESQWPTADFSGTPDTASGSGNPWKNILKGVGVAGAGALGGPLASLAALLAMKGKGGEKPQ